MVCIFCIAVVTLVAGATIGATVDAIDARLRSLTGKPVRKNVDSASVARWELTMTSGRTEVPVAVTVYKAQGRARLQVLTHQVPRADAELVLRKLAESLGMRVVATSDPASEELVRHATQTRGPAAAPREPGRIPPSPQARPGP